MRINKEGHEVFKKFHALVADRQGAILELPDCEMVARSGDLYRKPLPEELSVLPPEAEISFLPEHEPIVFDQEQRDIIRLWDVKNSKKQFPAAAILPIGFLRTLLPASVPALKNHFLPQWAYTAIGLGTGHQWIGACLQIETSDHWNNQYYNTPDLASKVKERLSKEPHNRILKQLSLCAESYHCSTAQNIFYQRWEGALPVSPACNAECVGCISLQPRDLPPSSHQRINFSPTLEEILGISMAHLEESPEPILSFGQGCEGEPLLAGDKIEKAIQAIRAKTKAGTLNINTNASRPESFRKLCKAGLEAVRISLNSAQKETYEAYYQPKGYSFDDVAETAKIGHEEGLAVSINLLTFPGVTDREEEVEALFQFIEETQINAIQWRNLAIDPDQYLQALPPRKGQILGIPQLLKLLKSQFPKLHHLSFSRPKEFFKLDP